MRPKHAIAVSLISATTIVVFKWKTDVFSRPGSMSREAAAGPLPIGRAFMRQDALGLAEPAERGFARSAEFLDSGMGAGPADFVDSGMGAGPADFVDAARMVVPATVHIVVNGDGQDVVSGSGAIISDDGYIVTNNHVIDGARTIVVTLSNRKTLQAHLIGADPASDLAVVKIDAADLPFLLYGNIEAVKVGQWVLAVGYPLSLQVTATAGIVSGMGRDLGSSFASAPGSVPGQWRTPANPMNRLDSFIQTDAAVNLGNSGGPLVNPAGQIIGINTAMATPNGAYTGYSFAIPVNIVQRVVNQLIAHGAVRKE